MLLPRDIMERTAWHLAEYLGELDVMQEIGDLANEKLTTEEIENEMLLRADIEGRTVWLKPVYWGNKYLLKQLWEWDEEELTTEEIKKYYA
jgi:hypothetical protein